MTAADAAAIADETIAYWQASGLTAREAWQALTGGPVWHADWWEVRLIMVRWSMSIANGQRYDSLPIAMPSAA